MPINVSEAIDQDTAEIVTVIRTISGGYLNGVYRDGPESTFKSMISVQQPSTQDLESLPENERTGDIRLFLSVKPLRTGNHKDNLVADKVYYKKTYYKVISIADWDTYGYTRALGVRV